MKNERVSMNRPVTPREDIMEKVTLKIKDSCAACAARIEKGLDSCPSSTAEVNLALEQATIEYDQTEVGIKDLTEKIEGLGYSKNAEKVEPGRYELRCLFGPGGGGSEQDAGGEEGRGESGHRNCDH